MTSISPSIESLPVEIFHRIFDHLDAKTIIFSFRSVCRLFRSIILSYNRYKFDFEIISKCNFHCLSRLIPPENWISLTLYHDERIPNQISFFASHYRPQQLTRLRSINIFGIDDGQLSLIFKDINLNGLISFSLNIGHFDGRRKKATEAWFSSIIAQPTLRKLEFNMKHDRLSKIQWPSNCGIEILVINENIEIDDLFRIISASPQLHTLVIKRSLFSVYTDLKKYTAFPQITSLSLGNFRDSMKTLESFLLLTSSLVYLKLISEDNGFASEFDGKCGEFLRANLLHLNKFEFALKRWTSNVQTQDDIKLFLQSFQTPFWIEDKKWFVAYEYSPGKPNGIHIYSIPICETKYDNHLYSEKIFHSTSTDLLSMDNINRISLTLTQPANINMTKKISTTFEKAERLRLDFVSKLSTDIINHLQPIFNPLKLIEVHLTSKCFGRVNKDLLFNVVRLIEQSSKLTSLIIYTKIWKSTLHTFVNDLCLILPRQIKYLEIPIQELEQVEIIFQRCPDLLIVKLETRQTLTAKVVEWFNQNTIDSVFEERGDYIHVWIGKKINPINDNRKRIKLMKKESIS